MARRGICIGWGADGAFPTWGRVPLETRRLAAAAVRSWWRPEDFTAELRLAWSETALEVEFWVRSRRPLNDAPVEKLWSQDCLELFLDGGASAPEFGERALHLTVAPGGEAGRHLVIQPRPLPQGTEMRIWCREGAGWGGRIHLPWSALGGFAARPGAVLGLGAYVSDHSANMERAPFVRCRRLNLGPEMMGTDPRLAPRWTLAEDFEAGAGNDLTPHLAWDMPPLFFGEGCRLEAPAEFALRGVGEAECVRKGKAWELEAARFPEGPHEAQLEVLSASGAVLGRLRCPFTRFEAGRLERVREAARVTAASARPAWGLSAVAEQIRRSMELEDGADVAALLEEAEARMALLRGEDLPAPAGSMLRLLELGRDAGAQVSVEYPRRHPSGVWKGDAVVKVFCGPVPLVVAECSQEAPAGETTLQWIPAVYTRDWLPTENPPPGERRCTWTTPGRNDLVVRRADGVVARVRCIAAAAAETLGRAIAENRPLDAAACQACAEAVAAELERRGIAPLPLPGGLKLWAGDVHCHTILSDGLATPFGLVSAARYGAMDFVVVCDHETIRGGLAAQEELARRGISFPVIAGEENSLPDGHFCSYPLTREIHWGTPLAQIIETAHAQGAIVQYNHPATFSNRRDLQAGGIAGTGLDAWEHELPPYAANWPAPPPLTGSSDCHDTCFPLERTLALMPRPDGAELAAAIRRNRCAILAASQEAFCHSTSRDLPRHLAYALRHPEEGFGAMARNPQ